MGTKYTTTPVSGFNASPPADDGSISAANQVKYATLKTKLADPLNVAIAAIDAGLVTAFDYSARSISTSDSAIASDHMKTIEIAPTVSSVVTITLSDAATMAAGYTVNIVNRSNFKATITRATTSDTINGSAASETLLAMAAVTYKVNSSANGYTAIANKASNSSVLSINTTQTTVAPGATNYIGTNNVSGTEGNVIIYMPFACTLKNMHMNSAAVPGLGETYTYTLRKLTVDTTITGVTSGGASSGCSDLTHEAEFAAGDYATMKIVASGGAAASIHWGTLEVRANP